MFGLSFANELDPTTRKELEALISQISQWALEEHDEEGSHSIVAVTPDAIPVGMMGMWGSNTLPAKWFTCDGSQLNRVKYKSLFDVIGTTYGVGDGSTTFNLPDFRQRFPLGKAASGTGSSLAATGGSIDHTHSLGSGTTGAAGGHGHTVSGSTSTDGAHDHFDLTGNTGFNTSSTEVQSGTGTSVASVTHSHSGGNLTTNEQGDHSHSVTGTTDTVSDHTHSLGSGTTGTGNPPFLVVNYIIFAGVA